MSNLLFVTAHVSPTDITQVRQGWLTDGRNMVGESGEKYRVYGAVTVVINPPESPSEEAQRVIDEVNHETTDTPVNAGCYDRKS